MPEVGAYGEICLHVVVDLPCDLVLISTMWKGDGRVPCNVAWMLFASTQLFAYRCTGLKPELSGVQELQRTGWG